MRRLLIGLAAALLLTAFLAAGQAEDSYAAYLDAHAGMPLGEQDILVDIFQYETEDIGLTEEEIAGERALCWRTALGSVSFSVDVPKSGLYWVAVRYAQLDGASGLIERGLAVDGEAPFLGCGNFYFPKRFADSQYPFEKNEYGNDVRPQQQAVYTPCELYLRDRNEMTETPLQFYFEAGRHLLTLQGVKGSLALLGIALVPPQDIPQDTRDAQAGGQMVTREAEEILLRSSKSIQNVTASEPGVTPSQAGYKLLNALGGSNWDNAGDFVEWELPVAQAGYYSLAFHFRQDFHTPMTSFRRVEIDGKTPSQAFGTVAFPFGAGWQVSVPGGEQPAYVYLDEGVHTLRLTCVNAPYFKPWEELQVLVEEMKALDLSIKEIIGTDSDVYRIWHLEKYIPSIESDLDRMAKKAREIQAALGEILGGADNLGGFTAAAGNLEKLVSSYNSIAKRTDSLSEIYTVFSDWLEYMTSQPLTLDKLYLLPAGQKAPAAGASFWEQLQYGASSFWRSFFNTGEDLSAGEEQAVTVWVQRSRDYVDMMQFLADEYYTKQTGVKVNVSYCPPGSQLLVLANAAGQQPDVVTGVDIALPFEFGIRNALVDLSQLEGFEELIAPIAPGSRIPNYFSGAEYGIAEEIRVKVMFYRRDVLERLNIPLPQTWPDATNALSTLLQNHYALYYPYGDYLTFFFQNDVDVYTPDGRGLAFTNEKGFSTFRFWTELYVKYGLQPAMSSFYQHFRIGDVPLGIADIDQYLQFDLAAPDISGWWDIALVPGTEQADGSLSRWQAGAQTCAVMFKTTEEKQKRAWDFLRWWLSTDTQTLYAESMESCLGEEFRWFSANLDVVASQDWPDSAKQVLLEQMRWYKQLPMVPGGSYMTSRELWNAWTRIVVDKGNYREEIEAAVEDIELEIGIKQLEMGYIDQDGNTLIPMSLMTLPQPGKEETAP